jgi:hypothetical protein
VATTAALLASAPVAAGPPASGTAGAPDAVDFASGAGGAGCCVEGESAAVGGAGVDRDVSLVASEDRLDVAAAGGDDCVAALSAVSVNSIR